MFCSILSSGGHLLFADRKGLSNTGRGSPKEHSCESISKSIYPFRGVSELGFGVPSTTWSYRVQPFRERSCFEVLFIKNVALATILLCGAN